MRAGRHAGGANRGDLLTCLDSITSTNRDTAIVVVRRGHAVWVTDDDHETAAVVLPTGPDDGSRRDRSHGRAGRCSNIDPGMRGRESCRDRPPDREWPEVTRPGDRCGWRRRPVPAHRHGRPPGSSRHRPTTGNENPLIGDESPRVDVVPQEDQAHVGTVPGCDLPEGVSRTNQMGRSHRCRESRCQGWVFSWRLRLNSCEPTVGLPGYPTSAARAVGRPIALGARENRPEGGGRNGWRR